MTVERLTDRERTSSGKATDPMTTRLYECKCRGCGAERLIPVHPMCINGGVGIGCPECSEVRWWDHAND
jgi:hypothetical protein